MKRTYCKDQNKYFFDLKGDELALALKDKIEEYQEYCVTEGHYNQWRKNERFYHNNFFSDYKTVDIVDTGSEGELQATSYNHFRNVLRHSLNQITSSVPAFGVSAINTDIECRRASKIGKNIVQYYFKIKRAQREAQGVAEKGIVHGKGHFIVEWNPTLGSKVTIDEEGREIKEGDFEYSDYSVFDYFIDPSVKKDKDLNWFIFRRKRNKFDQAKIFPKYKREILALSNNHNPDALWIDNIDQDAYLNSEQIYEYVAYHKATPSLPDGKHVIFYVTGEGAFSVYEGKSIYGDILPRFTLSPADYIDSVFGFTEANVIRAPQEIINVVISSLITNANAAGVNNIWAPKGSNLNIDELLDGLNLLETDLNEKPEVISFYKDLPGLKDLMQISISAIETLSAQNAAVRGNVKDTPNLKSGVAIATVINMAQQYSQALEKSYIEMFEDVSTFMIKTLQKTAKVDRIIDIVGKANATSATTFKRDDLKGISRVYVDQVNPIIKQPSGKIEIALELLKLDKITPIKFFDVINTGNLENATEADEKMLDFIRDAKERIMEGDTVLPGIPGIDHRLYIEEIASLLRDLDVITRPENKQLMMNIMETLGNQMKLVREGDEIANLIFGGKQPTPKSIGPGEVTDPQQLMGVPNQNQDPNQPPPIANPTQPPPGMAGPAPTGLGM